jgi:hypothetical protein
MSNDTINPTFILIREKVSEIIVLEKDDIELIKLLSKNELIEIIKIMNINIDNFCGIIITNK